MKLTDDELTRLVAEKVMGWSEVADIGSTLLAGW